MSLKTIKSIRPKKIDLTYFNLSFPAFITGVAYFTIVILVLLPFDFNNQYNTDDTQNQITPKYNFGYRLLLVLILLIPFGLSIYSINCMMVGGCIVWSYIQCILILLWVLLFVLMIILSNNNKLYLAQ